MVKFYQYISNRLTQSG